MRRHIVQIKSRELVSIKGAAAALNNRERGQADAPSSAIIVISLSISFATSQSVKHLMPSAASRRARSLETSSSRMRSAAGQIDRAAKALLARCIVCAFL
jgi:hypothetical protein